MKFISILREAHVSDEYAIAHSRLAIPIIKKKVVLRVHGEPVLWQLRAIPAMLFHHQAFSSHALRP